jgi:hypothetical protein
MKKDEKKIRKLKGYEKGYENWIEGWYTKVEDIMETTC